MKIFVIILNWNGLDDTLKCLSSLRAVKTAHSVVMVDNGSTDGSAQAVTQSFPEVHVIQTEENLGYAEGNNAGLRYSLEQSPDYVLILNNDTVVDPGILEAFLNRNAPIQGGTLHQMSNPSRLDHLGGMWNSQTGKFDPVAFNESAELWTKPLKLDYVCGCALFVKAEVFREVGLFDARFFLLWEECDWCYRAAQSGYPATVCPEAKVYHRVSASFVGGTPHTTYYWWRNRLLWLELHIDKVERRRLMLSIMSELKLKFRIFMNLSAARLFRGISPREESDWRDHRATIAGVRDYFFRRFGRGPRWLMKRQPRAKETHSVNELASDENGSAKSTPREL